MGRVICKKGENIKRVEKLWGVKIDKKEHDLHVEGAPQAVAQACAELQVAVESVPVDPSMMGWVCGKGLKTLNFLQEISGVLHMQPNREDGLIEVFGREDQLDDAKL